MTADKPEKPLPSYPTMILLLGLLSCVGPATIDAYLPAFGAIGGAFAVTPEAVQQTLGVYMCAYALMMLFHGSLSDSFGRKRVVCIALVVYLSASLGAACASDFDTLLLARIAQGLSSGAGIVVGQAIIRDCYDGASARKAMSYLVMVFNISPALAPVLGGLLIRHQGWRAVFVAMALLALTALLMCTLRLPETLTADRRQPFSWRALIDHFRRIAGDRQFAGMSLSFGCLFAGQAFIIGAAPDLIFNVLGMEETDFMVLFVPLVTGAMLGAWFSARMASRLSGARLILLSFMIMGGSALLGILLSSLSATMPMMSMMSMMSTSFWTPFCIVMPLSGYICGLAMSVPSMTMQILARFPELSGTAASVLGFVQVLFFSVISGWCVPIVYGRPVWLATALLVCVCAAAAGWASMQRHGAQLAIE